MSILATPCLWTHYLAIVPGRARSEKTWRTYATGLMMWLRACDAKKWDWREPSEERIATFRDYLANATDPDTGRRLYKIGTVNSYVNSVCIFYDWAARKKHISVSPVQVEVYRRIRPINSILAHLKDRSFDQRRILSLPEGEDDEPPHYFTLDERRKLLLSLAPRDRLTARWALYAGMRIFEITELLLNQIPPIGSYDAGKHVPVQLWKTKRNRPRKAWVPSFILDETWHYIQHERRRVVASARKRGTISENPQRLWLNRYAAPITDEGIRERFTHGLTIAGITGGNFHDLRHTYAITMLDRLLRQFNDPERGEKRALLGLKRLMGHMDTKSTEIYLQAREINLADLAADDMEVPERIVSTT